MFSIVISFYVVCSYLVELTHPNNIIEMKPVLHSNFSLSKLSIGKYRANVYSTSNGMRSSSPSSIEFTQGIICCLLKMC